MSVILWVFIIIIIIIIVLAIVAYSKIKPAKDYEHIYKYHELKNKFKTGDVILFSCRVTESKLESFKYFCRTKILGSEYGHVGLIYRDNNGKLFVIECTSRNHTGLDEAIHLNDKEAGGVRIIDMDILLDLYTKENKGLYGVRFISEAIPNEVFMTNVNKYNDKIFESKTILIILAFIDEFISNNLAENLSQTITGKNRMMCSEFAYNVLYDSDVINKSNPKIFWPQYFDDKFKDFGKKSYSDIYKFSLDGK